MSSSRLLTIFTRTPLHVGAGASVGAIDQPVIRERHTGFPVIPGSSIKGVLADLWHADISETEKGRIGRDPSKDITWLFGSDDANGNKASAAAISVGEARLLAFPIRSAKGSFAWVTSPTLIARAARDGVAGITPLASNEFAKLSDAHAFYANDSQAPLNIPPANGAAFDKVVLEDYVLKHAGSLPDGLAEALASLASTVTDFRTTIGNRLVVVSDGMMSHFSHTACEIAQHVRINDATGTAAEGGLFNQENVPADTLFYAVIHATKPRSAAHRAAGKTPLDALNALDARLSSLEVKNTLQIGGDATTGLGFCTVLFAA